MIEHAYIHIPFCIRKCYYCSFVSGFNINDKDTYIDALLYEIKERYKKDKLRTLYIGGGTPLLLNSGDIKKITDSFSYDNNAEITIEANPETVEYTKLKELKDTGVNRVSLGVQTFNNSILEKIGRKHNEDCIYRAVDIIKKAAFNNISIDLIYGLPSQTLNLFKNDLQKAVNLNINHISTYGLKIEENSYFYNNMPSKLPDEDAQAEMFQYLCRFLKENNFEHYEISNFAKKGFKSQHNCAYWKNKNYYGFGLNASGYENNIRYKNTCNFDDYIKNPFIKSETISLCEREILENEIFLALRLNSGLDIKEINKKYNIDFEKKYKNIINKFSGLNLLKITDNHCKLTEEGILLSNEIMSEFID